MRKIMILAVLLVAGCQSDHARREEYIRAHPGLSPVAKETIRGGWAAVGLTRDELIAAKGMPDDVQRSVTAGGEVEIFVYYAFDIVWGYDRSRWTHVYLRNGRVVHIHHN